MIRGLSIVAPFGEDNRIIPVTCNVKPSLYVAGPLIQVKGKSGWENIGRILPRDPAVEVGDGNGHDNPEVVVDAIHWCREAISHGANLFGIIAVSDSGQRVVWRGNVDLYGYPVDSEEYPAPKSPDNPGWAEF